MAPHIQHRLARLDAEAYALPPQLASRVISPALVVYLDAVRRNLRAVLARVGGDPSRWRPHVKTTKIPVVFAEMLAAGLRGFKCATTREADRLSSVLRDENVQGGDVLVAYPLPAPALQRLGILAKERTETRFSVLCEDPASWTAIPPEVDVFVDVNPGMNRTGVPLEDRRRILQIARLTGERFRGVHFYEGHLVHADRALRREAAFESYDALLELLAFLTDAGLRVPEVVTSGTPTFLDALDYPRFAGLDGTMHRVSPGTVVYHDVRSEERNPDLALDPAALVFTRVVSLPAADVATCDAGSKSIAAEAGDPCAFVVGRPGLLALAPSEEHLPLRAVSEPAPCRGTELLLVPRHVCPTVNLAEEAILIDGGELREVVPVSARGHDLLP